MSPRLARLIGQRCAVNNPKRAKAQRLRCEEEPERPAVITSSAHSKFDAIKDKDFKIESTAVLAYETPNQDERKRAL
jgi:hypothetical protein